MTFGIPGMRIGGELWGAVLVPQPDGTTVLRQLPKRRPRRTAGQGEAAARFRPVAEAWRALSLDDLALWRDLARATGEQPYRLFTGLAARCLQMRPGEPVPARPPERPFQGDGIVVEARASAEGRGVRFSTLAPNAPGVVTELLLQPLKSRNRAPVGKEYRTRAFVAFAPGALERTVEAPPGAWACAARFVREASGQAAGLIELGVVEVRI